MDPCIAGVPTRLERINKLLRNKIFERGSRREKVILSQIKEEDSRINELYYSVWNLSSVLDEPIRR